MAHTQTLTSAPIPETEPDADLLAACAAFHEADAETDKLNRDGQDHQTDWDATVNKVGEAWWAALRRIEACPAPTTPEGLRAKALASFAALKREVTPQDGDDWRDVAELETKLVMECMEQFMASA